MRLALALVVAVAALSAPAARVRAQCPGQYGESAFSGDPAPPCVDPPPVLPPIRIALDLRTGWHDTDAPVDHAAFGAGLSLDVALLDALEIGARVAVQSGRDVGQDATGDRRDDLETGDLGVLLVTGGPRLVLYTEPARREAFRFGLDAGALIALADGAVSGPVLELVLERQAGMLRVPDGSPTPSSGTGIEVGFALRLQQGLADAEGYHAVLASLYTALELGVRLPRGEPPRRTRPKLAHVLDVGAHTGFSVTEIGGVNGGGSIGLGLPILKLLVVTARADVTALAPREGGDAIFQYGIVGGVRIPRWFPAYFEVRGGWLFAAGTQPIEVGDGPVLDLALGMQLTNIFGCGVGLFAGAATRIGLGRGTADWATVGIDLGIRYDSLIRAAECVP